jgi:hypothetical protein
MTPTKPETSKNPKSPETKSTESAAPAVAPAPTVAAPLATGKTDKASKPREGRRVLSVSIPEKLARQVKLLCNVTGQSAQQLVEAALRRAVNKQLAGALESIKSDVEG